MTILMLLLCLTNGPELSGRMELDRGVLSAGENVTAIVKLSLEAGASKRMRSRPPVNLAIALDRSGSMSGQKLTKAKEAAIAAYHAMAPDDLFSLVIYDDRIETVIPAAPVKLIQGVEARILGLSSGNKTALFAGVSQAAAQLRRNLKPGYLHRLILLSDGLANVGPSSPSDLGRLGAALAKEGITVSTVGVGNDYNEDLMTRLSQSSDGNTYYAESSADLPRIFKAELGDVFAVVAKNVRARLDFPDGVKPVEIIGREGLLGPHSVEIGFNEIYGEQEKYALIRIQIAEAQPQKEIALANAEWQYTDVSSQQERRAAARLNARASRDQNEVLASRNTTVERGYLLNSNVVAQERAIDLADEGDVDQAVRELKESRDRLQEMGAQNQDPVLLKKAEEMDKLAQQIDTQGMSKSNRKQLRTDAYQTKIQQKTQQPDPEDDQDP